MKNQKRKIIYKHTTGEDTATILNITAKEEPNSLFVNGVEWVKKKKKSK